MKTILLFIKDHWLPIAFALALGVIAVFLMKSCSKPIPDNQNEAKIDSLTNANHITVLRADRKADSLTRLISASDSANKRLTGKLDYISEKYAQLRGLPHSVDTLVKWDTLMDGMECLEKMPIYVLKIENLESQVGNLKLKVLTREDEIKAIQGQFESSIALNKQQNEDLKKLARKLKWHKFLNYAEAGIGVAAITAILILKP